MLSDASRLRVAVACLLGLLVCFAWWGWLQQTGVIGYAAYTAAPMSRQGQDVALSLVRVAEIESVDRYVVEKGTLRIPVHGPTGDLEVGEDVSVGGIWRDRALEQRWIEHREAGRRAKRILGLLGLAVVVVLLGRSVRPGTSGLVLDG